MRNRVKTPLCGALGLWLALAAANAFAQSATPFGGRNTTSDSGLLSANEPAIAGKDGKILHAFRIATKPPTIDGLLNDEAWTLAPSTEGFVQWDPDNGEPATERTVMQVAYDDKYVYVAVHC